MKKVGNFGTKKWCYFDAKASLDTKEASPVSNILLFRIWLFLVCSTKQIVYTDTIEVGEGMQSGYRDIQLSQFIVRVGGLMNA